MTANNATSTSTNANASTATSTRSTIERATAAFSAVLRRQVRGIFDVRFVWRSQPYAAYYGTDRSAFHVYDLNGDLFKILTVNRGELARNPVATAEDAARRAVDNW